MISTPTLREFCLTTAYTLTQAGVDSPGLSARLLLGHVLGLSRVEMAMQTERCLSEQELRAGHELVQRRALGEPVALIIGHKEFYGRNFKVSSATLVPRPETEHLIEYALKTLPDKDICFADLGTGSGCIAVTLCCERPRWQGIMLDISEAALTVACTNAAQYCVTDRILALQADMTKLCLKDEQFDVIISNPPYVSAAEYAGVSREVRNFEPRTALQPTLNRVGMSFEPTGLGHIRALAQHAHTHLKAGGLFLVEHGSTQGSAVRQLFTTQAQWEQVETQQDLAGLERFCSARKTLK